MSNNYYDNITKTTANSEEFITTGAIPTLFPEGLYIGKLHNSSIDIPALVDLIEKPAIGFLYNNEETQRNVNNCIERFVWRVALSLPPEQTQFLLFNGSNPGEVFNSHSLINSMLFPKENIKVYFNGNMQKFNKQIDSLYDSIVDRMSTIHCANFSNLVELNTSFGKSAKHKYTFIVITDFPNHLKGETIAKVSQLISALTHTGIFVVMSWDMNAKFGENDYFSSRLDPKSILQNMELIFPSNNRFCFKNSGHDEVFNRFQLELDSRPINIIEAKQWAVHLDQIVLRQR